MGIIASAAAWVLSAFIGMEGVTYLVHKYVMHGFLWRLHFDHHNPKKGQWMQENDWFFVFFAIIATALFIVGALVPAVEYFRWIAVGVTLYGVAYFLVHDIFIHRRIKLFRNSNNKWLLALRRGHKAHHKHMEKEEGECFGMLWVPKRYFK